jgi:hypothetical protein
MQELGNELEVGACLPDRLQWQFALRRLVAELLFTDPVHLLQPRYERLGAHGQVAALEEALDRTQGGGDVFAVRVSVDQYSVARLAAKELVHGHPGRLAFDVPEREIDGADRVHRHRPAAPVGASIEVLPDVLDLAGVATDQERADVIGEVTRDGQLAPVQGRVAESGKARLGCQLQGDEVPARGADKYLRIDDLHLPPTLSIAARAG